MHSLPHALVASLCTGFLAAQHTWVVNPAGPGNFTTLGAAEAAAAPGDTILVRGSTYASPLTKPLHVVVESGQVVYNFLLVQTAGSVSLVGDFTDVLVLSGTVNVSDMNGNLRVDGGIVAARNCNFVTGQSAFAGVQIRNGCRGVFDECTFRGNDAVAHFGSRTGSPGLEVTGTAQLRNCSLIGGADASSGPILVHGGPGIAVNGSAELKNCQLQGGASQPLVAGAGTVQWENTIVAGSVPLPATIQTTQAALPWTTGSNAAPGGTLQCRVDASPTTLTLVFASLGMQAPFLEPVGEYWTDRAGTVVLSIGVTDALGSLPYTTAIPSFVPRGLQLTFQSLMVPTSGPLAVSAPAILQVL